MSENSEDRWTPWLLIALLAVQLLFLAGLYVRLGRVESRLAHLQQQAGPAGAAEYGGLAEERVPGVEPGNGPAKGAEEAPVTLVEFSDFSCGACQKAQPMLAELIEDLDGEVRIVYRHFPLRPEGDSFQAAVAAECAYRQKAFWEFHDRLFAQTKPIIPQDLPAHATAVGLDMEAFSRCTSSEDAANKVHGDREAGVGWGVQGTPTFFINGYRVTGMPGLAAIKRIIDRAQPAATKASGPHHREDR